MARRVILQDAKTKEELHPRTEVASVTGLQEALGKKADLATTYTKTEVDALITGEYYAS